MPIALLAAEPFGVDDDVTAPGQLIAGQLLQPATDIRWQGLGTVHVKTQLDRRRHLVDVLPPRAGGQNEFKTDVFFIDRQVGGCLNPHLPFSLESARRDYSHPSKDECQASLKSMRFYGNQYSIMKIKNARALTGQSWLNLFEIDYTDKSGRDRTWQLVSRAATPKCMTGAFDRPDAVLMVPYHIGCKKLAVIREYRVALADYQYEFPAGLLDKGETVEQAARRELKEETGLDLTTVTRHSPAVYNSAGLADESVRIVFCECDGQPSTTGNEGSEEISVQLLTPVGAGKLLASDHVKFDAKCWLILNQFAAAGRTM